MANWCVSNAARATAVLAFAVITACDPSQGVMPNVPEVVNDAVNHLSGARLFVDPNSPAQRQANDWRVSRPGDATLMTRIASQPVASWIGDWSTDVRRDVAGIVARASESGAMPVFVAYNIPNRDCGSYSAGGAASASAYRQWIRDFAAGLTGAAAVVLEPDAVAGADCLSPAAREERYELLRDAIQVMKAAHAVVYVDAGNASWHSPEVIASRLATAGIGDADGFALNVSNYLSTSASTTYGDAISARLGGSHYIIDTSRNGLGGAAGEWCNVPNQALGASPTTSTGYARVDAFLWVKYPGESDGTCNDGPAAGTWWAEYALGLAQRQTTVVASR